MQMAASLEISISCKDLDKMLVFYTDFLNCKVFDVVTVSSERAKTIPLVNAGYRVARTQTTSGKRIKFLASVAERLPVPKTDEVMMCEDAFYITFIVEDLDALPETLRAKGVPMLQRYEKVEIWPGFFVTLANDPEGNVIEFNEYADLASYRPDLVEWIPRALPNQNTAAAE